MEESANDRLIPVYQGDEVIFITPPELYARHIGWAVLDLVKNINKESGDE